MSQGGNSEVQHDTTTAASWTADSNSGENNITVWAVDSKTSSLANAAAVRGDAVVDVKGGGGGKAAEQEMTHVRSEKERRKKMSCMYSELHALLPHPPAKGDRASIVDEAVNYIKHLEEVLQKLEKQKLERMCAQAAPPATGDPLAQAETAVAVPVAVPAPALQTWYAPNAVLRVAGDCAYLSMCLPRRQHIVVTVLSVLEKHQIDVAYMTVSSDESHTMLMIHARANQASQLPNKMTFEEIYKAAVSEMFWLLN